MLTLESVFIFKDDKFINKRFGSKSNCDLGSSALFQKLNELNSLNSVKRQPVPKMPDFSMDTSKAQII